MKIDEFINTYTLFVDTCSFMRGPSADIFFGKLKKYLITNRKQIIVINKVINELRKMESSDRLKISELAVNGLNVIKHFKSLNLIKFIGRRNDPYADNLFVSLFARYREKNKLVLITQDKKLAMRIDRIGQLAFFISDTGSLTRWKITSETECLSITEKYINRKYNG